MADLREHGLNPTATVHANLAAAELAEHAVRRGEAILAENGALVAYTGQHTGRAPRDKYVVAEPSVQDQVAWGNVNQPMTPAAFDNILRKTQAHLQHRDLYVFDGWACSDPAQRIHVRVIAEKAWHALFSRCLLLRPTPLQLQGSTPKLVIYAAPELRLNPATDQTRTETCIALSLERGLVVVAGTHYAGEIKKSVFSYLNYRCPQSDVFPMHCSATLGPAGDTALFFGLSGTGKTTLSADPQRRLIGDDEHGWSVDGVFNFEGGCYAKTIKLSPVGEPQIHAAIRFGAILENVPLDACRRPNYDDDRITENTRAGYPLDFIPGAEPTGRGGHPRHVLFLTCDAFGVLPPVSKLTIEQALYHFLSGYTAKIPGTEGGVKEPQATFSTCFAAPFLPLPPTRYAQMLEDKLRQHRAQVWLVNTGWTGGPYGQGKRIPLPYTRGMVSAILTGALHNVPCRVDPLFRFAVPESCPGVPSELFQPRVTWSRAEDFDAQAGRLAHLFRENFEKYAGQTSTAVRESAPTSV